MGRYAQQLRRGSDRPDNHRLPLTAPALADWQPYNALDGFGSVKWLKVNPQVAPFIQPRIGPPDHEDWTEGDIVATVTNAVYAVAEVDPGNEYAFQVRYMDVSGHPLSPWSATQLLDT